MATRAGRDAAVPEPWNQYHGARRGGVEVGRYRYVVSDMMMGETSFDVDR